MMMLWQNFGTLKKKIGHNKLNYSEFCPKRETWSVAGYGVTFCGLFLFYFCCWSKLNFFWAFWQIKVELTKHSKSSLRELWEQYFISMFYCNFPHCESVYGTVLVIDKICKITSVWNKHLNNYIFHLTFFIL